MPDGVRGSDEGRRYHGAQAAPVRVARRGAHHVAVVHHGGDGVAGLLLRSWDGDNPAIVVHQDGPALGHADLLSLLGAAPVGTLATGVLGPALSVLLLAHPRHNLIHHGLIVDADLSHLANLPDVARDLVYLVQSQAVRVRDVVFGWDKAHGQPPHALLAGLESEAGLDADRDARVVAHHLGPGNLGNEPPLGHKATKHLGDHQGFQATLLHSVRNHGGEVDLIGKEMGVQELAQIVSRYAGQGVAANFDVVPGAAEVNERLFEDGRYLLEGHSHLGQMFPALPARLVAPVLFPAELAVVVLVALQAIGAGRILAALVDIALDDLERREVRL